MDTKKYIIEIPDNTAWIQWVKVSDKDGHVCFDSKDPEDLTLYTEPDLDAVRKEAYEKGVQDTKQHWVDAPRSCAYQLGYENGLNAAWDAVKKLARMDTDTSESITGQFGLHNIMHNLTASEAIEKIRQYEQDKKQINVWDEVQHKCCNRIKIVVLNKEGDAITGIAIEDVPYACKVGEMYINRDVKDWEKTGKHYEIAEVLKKDAGERIMSRLDDTIADVAYILDTLMAYRNITDTGNCNSCKNKNCQWKPEPGQLARYNCPHYKAEEEV